MNEDFPTADELRAQAEAWNYFALRTDGHEGHDDRERYRTYSRQCMTLAAKVEANPHYFTEQDSHLRAA